MKLIEMSNIGKTSALWLCAVGIRTPEKLSEIGAVEAFCRVKKRGFKISKVFLYSLEGALRDIPWSTLDEQSRKRLLQQVDEQMESVESPTQAGEGRGL